LYYLLACLLAGSFFDLFYVAAAYNLGNVLREDPTATGLLYVAGLFLPIQNIWTFKMYYDSRFYVSNDYFHRGYEIALLLALATAVLHIRPVVIMANPAQNIDMFYYCLSICIAHFLALGRLVEVVVRKKIFHCQYLFPEAMFTCLRELILNGICGAFILASAVYTGIEFYRSDDDSYSSSSQATTGDYFNQTATNDYPEEEGGSSHGRMAAAAAATDEKNYTNDPDNVAIWLLLAAVFGHFLWFLVQVVFWTMNKSADHRRHMVPMNVDYAIHRYGEWTMLMLGESVLSLLIVDIVETTGYYKTFIDGVISIVLVEYLHFQSQPSEPDKHAVRRSLPASFAFYWLMQIYSLALIVLGTSYKMLLYEFVYMEEYEENHRRRSLLFSGRLDDRWLAGGTSAALRFSSENRQQRIAHFFCGSLALVFFCMDAMSLAHRGASDHWKHCEAESKTKQLLALVLFLLRAGVVLIIATLSQYETEPDTLATIGLFSVFAQLLLRAFGGYIFRDDEENAEEQAMERMINYTAARLHDRPGYDSSSNLQR